MAERYTTMRLPIILLDLLKQECERLVRAQEHGWHQCPAYDADRKNPNAQAVTPADLVELLLAQRHRHRERRRAAKRRARGPKLPSAAAIASAGRADR